MQTKACICAQNGALIPFSETHGKGCGPPNLPKGPPATLEGTGCPQHHDCWGAVGTPALPPISAPANVQGEL